MKNENKKIHQRWNDSVITTVVSKARNKVDENKKEVNQKTEDKTIKKSYTEWL